MRSGVRRSGLQVGDRRFEYLVGTNPFVRSGANTDAVGPTLKADDTARAVLGESSRAAMEPSLRP
jgi:hypothetical protein